MAFFGTTVELGKQVKFSDLEDALLVAADEMNWEADVKHEFEKRFELGSVREVERYRATQVRLKGGFLPVPQMHVSIYNRDHPASFTIYSGFPYGGFASNQKVRQYLEAVSRHL